MIIRRHSFLPAAATSGAQPALATLTSVMLVAHGHVNTHQILPTACSGAKCSLRVKCKQASLSNGAHCNGVAVPKRLMS